MNKDYNHLWLTPLGLSLRLVSQVMQGTPRQQLNPTTINTLVQSNYTADVQHKLESAKFG